MISLGCSLHFARAPPSPARRASPAAKRKVHSTRPPSSPVTSSSRHSGPCCAIASRPCASSRKPPPAGTATKALADPNAYDLAALNEPQRKALIRFWEQWQVSLKTLRILDPACGSGAFLIEAFDQLHTHYEVSNARLEELRGHRTLFDLDRQILQHNLYGADLNAEAIQICQLSLWIKTAAHGKRLTSLDHSIREGNSVVSDPAVHPKAFDWHAAFPEVFAQGGFDVVVGNPPYIRQEWIAPYKPYWEQRYRSYHGVADIFVYFFEQGIELLRPGGQLAFITSGSWVRGNFGAPLRKVLSTDARMTSMVDFGEFQPFDDAEMIRPLDHHRHQRRARR